jgi:hypothetical protein
MVVGKSNQPSGVGIISDTAILYVPLARIERMIGIL